MSVKVRRAPSPAGDAEPSEFLFNCPLCGKANGRANRRRGADGRTQWYVDCWTAECPSSTYLRNVAETVGAPGGSSIKDDPPRWLAEYATRRRSTPRPRATVPSLASVEGWHAALLAEPAALAYLERERGITQDLIARVRLGYSTSAGFGPWRHVPAFTVPLVRKSGEVATVRKRFWPEVPTDERGRPVKYAGLSGHGARLYPSLPMVRAKDLAVLVAGEFDALAGRAYRLPTVSTTCGASLPRSLAKRFNRRPVAVVYDVGEEAAANATVRRLREAGASEAWRVDLSALGLGRGEDLTDFLVKRGRSAGELRQAIATARGSYGGQ
jgi:hypothetical protein